MKKLLIGSTALVAAGLLAGNASAADKIKLNLGGYMDNFVGFGSNKASYNNAVSGRPNIGGFDVQSDNEVHVSGSTKLDNGLTVAVKWEMETQTGASTTNVDSSSVSVSSATLGTIDLGSDDNAADKMHGGHAPSTASSFGLELGDNAQWVSAPSQVNYMSWTRSTGAADYYGISYRSPSFSGFQVGASYAAAMNETGQGTDGATADRNMWTAAIAYDGRVGDVTIGADVFYAAQGSGDLKGATQPAGYDQVGGALKVGFGAFEVAGAYKNVDQAKATTGTSTDGKVWSLGAGYKSGPMQVTVGWLRSQLEGANATAADDKVDIYNIEGAYDLGGGVKLSAVLMKAKYDDETTVASQNNEGWAAVAGVQVAF